MVFFRLQYLKNPFKINLVCNLKVEKKYRF